MANIRLGVTRYEKQNDLRIGSLKFKFRKPKVLQSSFDSNVVYYNIVSLHILSYKKDRQVIEKTVSQVRG